MRTTHLDRLGASEGTRRIVTNNNDSPHSLLYCKKRHVVGEGTRNHHTIHLPCQWIVFKRGDFHNLFSFNNKPDRLHSSAVDIDVGRNEALVMIVSEFSLFNKLL